MVYCAEFIRLVQREDFTLARTGRHPQGSETGLLTVRWRTVSWLLQGKCPWRPSANTPHFQFTVDDTVSHRAALPDLMDHASGLHDLVKSYPLQPQFLYVLKKTTFKSHKDVVTIKQALL